MAYPSRRAAATCLVREVRSRLHPRASSSSYGNSLPPYLWTPGWTSQSASGAVHRGSTQGQYTGAVHRGGTQGRYTGAVHRGSTQGQYTGAHDSSRSCCCQAALQQVDHWQTKTTCLLWPGISTGQSWKHVVQTALKVPHILPCKGGYHDQSKDAASVSCKSHQHKHPREATHGAHSAQLAE
jgi:hypothetical protein